MNSKIKRIEPLIEKKLSSMGLELYKLKVVKAGSRQILRLFIDNKNGVTIKDCERVSNEISVLLDVENFSQKPYTLEVSSPGIDRILTTEKDFKRVIGRKINLHLKESGEKSRKVQGRLIACSDGRLTVEMPKGIKMISISNIYSGKQEIAFKG